MIELRPDGSLQGNARIYDFGNAQGYDQDLTVGDASVRRDIRSVLDLMSDPYTFVGELLLNARDAKLRTTSQFISEMTFKLDQHPDMTTEGFLDKILSFCGEIRVVG